MSLSYIMARMQLLSGTTEEWTTGVRKDFVIMSNELAAEWETESDGYYSGFKGIKIGDGQNTFQNLPYVTNLDATTVLVGGNPVETFDADTKVNKHSNSSYIRVYAQQPNSQTLYTNVYLQANANIQSTQSGYWIPKYNPGTMPDSEKTMTGTLACGTPTKNYHAANKKYVDEQVQGAKDASVPAVSTASILYGNGADGNLFNFTWSEDANVYTIARRGVRGTLKVGTPTADTHATTKKYVDDNFIAKSGDGAIDGSFTIAGDLIVQGTTHTQDAETLRIVDNIIEINSEKADNETVLSGVAINKNANSTYGIMYDPIDDTVKFGEGQTEEGEFSFKDGEGAPLAIRDDSTNIVDGAIMIFDKSKNKLVDSGYTIDTFKQWVRDYVETYMSTEIIIDDNGNQNLSVTGEETVIDNPDGSQTLIIGG